MENQKKERSVYFESGEREKRDGERERERERGMERERSCYTSFLPRFLQ